MVDKEVLERNISLEGEAGEGTNAYFGMVKFLGQDSFKVKKKADWLKINPRSEFYSKMLQQKQMVEQQVTRLLTNITEMRKDIELIKHDLRKFKEVDEHFKSRDDEALKSDFVDLVDKNTPSSMLQLASAGKFPTLVIDFFKLGSKEDIKKLKISETEKSILRTKWDIYQYWKKNYKKSVDERIKMLKSELQNRQASLDNLKKTVKPYIKSVQQLREGEGKEEGKKEEAHTGIDDPFLVEGYSTTISGIELIAWKPVHRYKSHKYMEKEDKEKFFIFMEITAKKKQKQQREAMSFKIKGYLKSRPELEKEKENIEKKKKELQQEIKRFQGEEEGSEDEEDKKEGEKNVKLQKTIKNFQIVKGVIQKIAEKLKPVTKLFLGERNKYYISEGEQKELEKKVEKKVNGVANFLKGTAGGLK